jgi:hypothetical protein
MLHVRRPQSFVRCENKALHPETISRHKVSYTPPSCILELTAES